MSSILIDSVVVFLTQIIFIGSRTINVKAIADKNMKKALISGAIIHIAWLVSISIGVVSINSLMKDFNFAYLPVIMCSLIGGLLGTYWGLKDKLNKK
ncbi:hypothetical protein Phi13:2_gp008 [Cellulophaga phage phi13:2]|uniref:Uncharacterized protein n=1 Tax=Cellulophaga phage phi13:2 TaxID=1328030 RepID=S0A5M8_9CAUD|nr:hypothetical protein Phi13:2_gp008 [Cellulophaga phage phi13:2]AGO49618.1 hypothetical protein Phi13:2_gp008 [Cellulophaga phage phi13:2]